MQFLKTYKPGKRTIFIKYNNNEIQSYFLEFPEIRIYRKYGSYFCYFVKNDKLDVFNTMFTSTYCVSLYE